MRNRRDRKPADAHDWDARADLAITAAMEMPDGPERTEALRKAQQLKSAADMKKYLASKELKAPI